MIVEKKINGMDSQLKSANSYGWGIRHVQMACMWMCMVALFVVRSSLGVAVLAMTDARRRNDTNIEIYDWDKKTQGLLLSSFFWGYMMMQIPAALLAKKYGGKPILLMSLLANGLLCLILPTVAHYGGWISVCLCRVCMGLSQAPLFPTCHTLLGRWLPARERTTMMGLVHSGYQIGTIIAMPVSGVLAETAMGWKSIFYSMAGLMLLTAVIWFGLAASSPAEHRMISKEENEYIEMDLKTGHDAKQDRPTPWAQLFRSVPMWAITVTHIGSSSAFTLFLVDLPTYLEKAMLISLQNSAILAALPYLGMWVGGVVSSNICERIYNRGILSVGTCRKIFNSFAMFGIAIGCIVLASLQPEQKQAAVVALIGTLTMHGFISAGFMVNHLDLSPHFAGVMLSMTNFAANWGCIVTPVITSVLLKNDPSDTSNWRVVFLLVAGLTIGSNVFYVVFTSSSRQPWDSQDWVKRRNTIEELKPLKSLKQLQEKNEAD